LNPEGKRAALDKATRTDRQFERGVSARERRERQLGRDAPSCSASGTSTGSGLPARSRPRQLRTAAVEDRLITRHKQLSL
jgi:hypothetical protein